MMPLLAIIASLALFAGFLAFTRIETRRGRRAFAKTRALLDREADRAGFILAHVDFEGFVRDTARAVAARAVHECVRGILVAVRFIERALTRVIRSLRERAAVSAAAAPERGMRAPFVRAVRRVREEIHNARIIHGIESRHKKHLPV